MAAQITMTDADRAQGLLSQVQGLTQQVSALAVENATLRRAIVERDAAEAAAKEPKKAPEKKA